MDLDIPRSVSVGLTGFWFLVAGLSILVDRTTRLQFFLWSDDVLGGHSVLEGAVVATIGVAFVGVSMIM